MVFDDLNNPNFLVINNPWTVGDSELVVRVGRVFCFMDRGALVEYDTSERFYNTYVAPHD